MVVDRLDGFICQVRANNLHASGRDVLTAKCAHGVVIQSPLQNVKVPERPSPVQAVQSGPLGFDPLILWQVLRQLVLLRILDGHARDAVILPLAITLGSRRRIRTDTREDTSRRLVDQAVRIRQFLGELGPYTDFLTTLITLAGRITSGQADRRVSTKLTRNP